MQKLLEDHGYTIVFAPLREDIKSCLRGRTLIFNDALSISEYHACLKTVVNLIVWHDTPRTDSDVATTRQSTECLAVLSSSKGGEAQ